ncbi:FAD-dependent 5-carboxymethylaminomethyl-2-thiouridine(34) oxidoreductase MnmC [Shewanella loihica]|uniref:tRNA 5-methylaminomethyl-2-thiouridine biosynthesis bifunctional protein MnmC n=2 Tax=Shewanella TaxID=22 RepID=MNMC_SHELP|nr:RecName: Full=tRNA 5-methylaminomethyl-2-thiouridine biosynthesis bifunctional protein MnmC; Short=tRNA mnm(5)s(2)U biosynthesis bifunctional protein; Includes: RecName: Full=tRNA (mnm(5)s(2)U34)-methyltransferase; Includes: RecName: Full=FAD-dependent cmnm(5)s(2)U34 oxidoreductase [Shewanella loihica PV-4]ABO24277.1 FAD dependent oxidoreductase [Shewanella loihica PV-4]
MPNIPLRVNSLATEHPNNAQNSDKMPTFDAIFSHLSAIASHNSHQIIALLPSSDANWPAALIAERLTQAGSKQHLQKQHLHLHLFAQHQASWLKALAESETLASPAKEQIKAICDARVSGSHRLKLVNARLIIDIHLGDPLTQLKDLVSPSLASQAIQGWLANTQATDEALIWQMARLSQDNAEFLLLENNDVNLDKTSNNANTNLLTQLIIKAGFTCYRLNLSLKDDQLVTLAEKPSLASLEIAMVERRALRRQQLDKFAFNPLTQGREGETAIIGGGVASANLALSLAERGKKVSFFCMDKAPGEQASGNKQGAIYPLLTPEHGSLSHYFLLGYLFSRQRIKQLLESGHEIPHDFCGVLQTGHDERSHKRLTKIINAQPWAESIARPVDALQATALAGVTIEHQGIYYPLAGWVSPQAFTRAAISQAERLGKQTSHYQCQITAIRFENQQWYLSAIQDGQKVEFGPYANLVLANGRHLTDFAQTDHLPISGFRGQVSHIPERAPLKDLKTVLCAHGYLTPAHDKLHCTGASYVKDASNLDYSAVEQVENLDKIRTSYGGEWTKAVDITGHSARVGVRMVTRDHAPMMGCAPDFEAISATYISHQQTKKSTKESAKCWQTTSAPVHQGLFILGGLGSRGLTSGPLAAEILAAQLCGELLPATQDILALLNPNRMWMRKLIKGKAL